MAGGEVCLRFNPIKILKIALFELSYFTNKHAIYQSDDDLWYIFSDNG